MNEFDCLAEAMRRRGEPPERIKRCLDLLALQGVTADEVPPEKVEHWIAAITAGKKRCETDPEYWRAVDREAQKYLGQIRAKN